jgi:hypothetical protein
VRDHWIVDTVASFATFGDLSSWIDGAHQMRAQPDLGPLALSKHVASILPVARSYQTQRARIANRR